MSAEHDVNRIEAFSDAVFAFALTLLVVSLEVPDSFDDLVHVLRGLPVFAAAFAILLLIWQEHHVYFKRFGRADGVTIWLNGALLFVVLAYIYPLKFFLALAVGGRGGKVIEEPQLVTLAVIYGVGFVTIFLIYAILYWRAAAMAADPARRRLAWIHVGHSGVYVAVGVISMLIAVIGGPPRTGLAGMSYALLGPGQGLYHFAASRLWKGRALKPGTPETAPH